MTSYQYVGSELEVFEKARNWKRYFSLQLQPYLRGKVLEVGSGIGSNTKLFAGASVDRWTCLEPDAGLLKQFTGQEPAPERYEIIEGTLADIEAQRRFDAIIYIDVLEHIEDDREELRQAAKHLTQGGALIVLAPAHQFLFTPFDSAIGHYRRYSKATLAAVEPPALKREKLIYLDSVGMLASLANRLLLRSAMPTAGQIQTWDGMLVPCSRWLDPVLGYRLGKSILGIWSDHQGSP
jgi:SAM-dependent methyltransferase